MKTVKRTRNCVVILSVIAMLWLLCMTAAADSGDNSLYSLGLENATSIEPEFYYSTLEYQVKVPLGTRELLLSPVTSNAEANVIDISGAELDEGSRGTVYVTVEAPNGAQVSYVLTVSADEEVTAPAAESEADEEQKRLEEAQRQSESEEMARVQRELESRQQQINSLSDKNSDLTGRINMLMRVLYGLVGFAVLLLFFIINQSLRNKDLKDDLKEAKSQAEMNNEFARKEQTMQNSYYYNTPQNVQQGVPVNAQHPVEEATRNVQAAFGNASQVLQAQPMPGQVNAPRAAAGAPVAEQPMPAAPAPAPAEPTLVQGSAQEPDVSVEMIDL